MAAQPFVGKEEKKLVFPNGSAETCAKLAEIVIHTGRQSPAGPVVLVKCIPVRILILEKSGTVKLIRTALGDHLDLGAGAAAIFRGIGAGKNGDFLNGFLVWRDNRGASE